MTKITILVDDRAGPGLLPEHGLALWIEAGNKSILFDAGQGGALLKNARSLGIDLSLTEAIVLSHGHYDHTGGLAEVLSMARRAKVYLHPAAMVAKYGIRRQSASYIGMPEHSKAALRHVPEQLVCWVREPLEIEPGIWLTGPIPRANGFEDVGGQFYLDPDAAGPDAMEDDLALWIDDAQGLAVATGCAHAGLVNTLDHILKVSGRKRIKAVLGGFHLGGASDGRLELTAAALKDLHPDLLMPCHCTGEAATEHLHITLGGTVEDGVSGKMIVV